VDEFIGRDPISPTVGLCCLFGHLSKHTKCIVHSLWGWKRLCIIGIEEDEVGTGGRSMEVFTSLTALERAEVILLSKIVGKNRSI